MNCEIHKIQHNSREETELALFIKNCSWNKVKKHLLWELKNWNHEDWESFFVAVKDDKIIGMISIMKEDYYPLPDIYPYISSVFVSGEYRGQGICGQMIECVNA